MTYDVISDTYSPGHHTMELRGYNRLGTSRDVFLILQLLAAFQMYITPTNMI